jgi:hypothetical protein
MPLTKTDDWNTSSSVEREMSRRRHFASREVIGFVQLAID